MKANLVQNFMRAAHLLQKYTFSDRLMTTEEMKELRLLLSGVRDEVSESIALRVEEESK